MTCAEDMAEGLFTAAGQCQYLRLGAENSPLTKDSFQNFTLGSGHGNVQYDLHENKNMRKRMSASLKVSASMNSEDLARVMMPQRWIYVQ